jgi:ketosteroid isomerase-like protein
MSIEIQELAARYGAAWAKHDLDAIMAMHTDDTVFHLHGGGEPAVGGAATREAIATVLAQWPDIRFERKRVYIGCGHFVSEYEMSATNAEGQLLVCDGVDVFAVKDGRVARKDTYLDWPALQEQQRAAQVSAMGAGPAV